jgi:5S rRNA maturation endonuclease (ribonuclease M5)
MRREDVKTFLSLLGCQKIRDGGDWITASCPLSRWTHRSRTDRHPSFGVTVNNHGQSVFKCFTCRQDAVTLDALIFSISAYSKIYRKRASDFLNEYEIYEDSTGVEIVDKWGDARPQKKQIDTKDLSILSQYPLLSESSVPQVARDIITDRGSSISISDYFGVRWSSEDNALIFPSIYRGRVSSIKARSISRKEFWFPLGGLYLFGLHRLVWDKPVWIVEGEFDLLRLNALGEYNVLCLGGSSIPKNLADYLPCHTVILGFDNDDTGRDASIRFRNLFAGIFCIKEIDWRDVKDGGSVRDRAHLNEIKLFTKNL